MSFTCGEHGWRSTGETCPLCVRTVTSTGHPPSPVRPNLEALREFIDAVKPFYVTHGDLCGMRLEEDECDCGFDKRKARFEAAYALLQAAERPNLGELREQAVESVFQVLLAYSNGAPRSVIAQVIVDSAILPIIEQREQVVRREQDQKWYKALLEPPGNSIGPGAVLTEYFEQREREGVSKFRSKAEFYFSYWMNQGYDAHSCVRMGMDDAECELAKLKSQPKEGGK